MVQTEFPEVYWQWWKFTKAPKHLAITLGDLMGRGDPVALAAVRSYMEDLATAHHTTPGPHWPHDVSLLEPADRHRFVQLGSLDRVLSLLYPHHWQSRLTLREQPPNVQIHTDQGIDHANIRPARRVLENVLKLSSHLDSGLQYERLYQLYITGDPNLDVLMFGTQYVRSCLKVYQSSHSF